MLSCKQQILIKFEKKNHGDVNTDVAVAKITLLL